LPTSIVAIYWLGLEVKMDISPEDICPCFLSSSSLNLFAETNAISIPEKNAEKIREVIIIAILAPIGYRLFFSI